MPSLRMSENWTEPAWGTSTGEASSIPGERHPREGDTRGRGAGPSRVMEPGKVMPSSWTIMPRNAIMEMRPCLISTCGKSVSVERQQRPGRREISGIDADSASHGAAAREAVLFLPELPGRHGPGHPERPGVDADLLGGRRAQLARGGLRRGGHEGRGGAKGEGEVDDLLHVGYPEAKRIKSFKPSMSYSEMRALEGTGLALRESVQSTAVLLGIIPRPSILSRLWAHGRSTLR